MIKYLIDLGFFFFFFSLFAAFPPEQPNILNNETELTSRVFQLKWDKPNANGRQIDHYIVWHHELNSAVNSSEVKWKNVTVKTQSFNVNSSLWGTSYEIEIAVTAVNDQGESLRNKTKKFAAVPRGRFAVFVSYVKYLTKHIINHCIIKNHKLS